MEAATVTVITARGQYPHQKEDDLDETFGVEVTQNGDTSHTITGPKESVMNYLDEITAGSKESAEEIWETCQPPVPFPYVWSEEDDSWDYVG